MHRLSLMALMALFLTASLTLAAERAVPGQPVIVSPADESTTNTNAPLLQWTGDAAGTTSFKVVIKNDAGEKVYSKGNLAPADVCAGEDCSHSFGAENVTLANGLFSWRVIAKNAEGKSKSLAAAFTVDFPGTPELVAPMDGSSSGITSPTFEWNVVAAADQYRVKVKNTVTGEKFNSGDLAASTACAQTCTYAFPTAFAPGTYKWSVQAGQVTFPDSISKSVKHTFTIAPQ